MLRRPERPHARGPFGPQDINGVWKAKVVVKKTCWPVCVSTGRRAGPP